MKNDWIRKLACSVPLYLAVASTTVFSQTSITDGKSVKSDLHVVVRAGDTLTSIVKRELGSLELWPDVVRVNNLKSPDTLKPGDLIIIPWEMLQARNYARIVFFKGSVVVQRKGETEAVPATKGDKIYLGDIIRTGADGFVSLSFKGASQVNIQPDSDMELKELECFDVERACEIRIKTTSSDMKLDVRNLGFSEPTKFSIETPYASAAVRGTRFYFTTQNGNILGVTEGVVQISSDNQSNEVPLGKGVLAGEGQSIGVLFDLLDKPEYNDSSRISAQDYISWQPVLEAAGYEVVVAATESMSNVIRSSALDRLAVAALPGGGQYFVGTRAVAKNGLRGFEAVKRVDQVELDKSVQPPELDIELSGNTLKVKADGRFATEVQIGNRLDVIDDTEKLIEYKSYDVKAGDDLQIEIEPGKDIYLISRTIVSGTSVSAYSNLYEFKRAGK